MIPAGIVHAASGTAAHGFVTSASNPQLPLQVLGGMLQIPAFPFWRLEAALAPGPAVPKPPAPAKAAGAGQPDEEEDQGAGSKPAEGGARSNKADAGQVCLGLGLSRPVCVAATGSRAAWVAQHPQGETPGAGAGCCSAMAAGAAALSWPSSLAL